MGGMEISIASAYLPVCHAVAFEKSIFTCERTSLESDQVGGFYFFNRGRFDEFGSLLWC